MARVPEYQQMIGEPAVPDVRTRVQASPADFGAARDQALEGLGATVEQFGQEMARLDEHLSQVAAQKAFEKTRAQSMAIMTEFGNLEGDNAVNALAGTQAKLEQAARQNSDGLNPYANQLYDRFVTPHLSADINAAVDHAAREGKRSEIATKQNILEQSVAAFASSATFPDQIRTAEDTAKATSESLDRMHGRPRGTTWQLLHDKLWGLKITAHLAAGEFVNASTAAGELYKGRDEAEKRIETASKLWVAKLQRDTYTAAEGQAMLAIDAASQADTPDGIWKAYESATDTVNTMIKSGNMVEGKGEKLIAAMEKTQIVQLTKLKHDGDLEQRTADKDASARAFGDIWSDHEAGRASPEQTRTAALDLLNSGQLEPTEIRELRSMVNGIDSEARRRQAKTDADQAKVDLHNEFAAACGQAVSKALAARTVDPKKPLTKLSELTSPDDHAYVMALMRDFKTTLPLLKTKAERDEYVKKQLRHLDTGEMMTAFVHKFDYGFGVGLPIELKLPYIDPADGKKYYVDHETEDAYPQ